MKVTIFTETSTKAPKTKDGWYAAVAEYITDSKTYVKEVSGYEMDSTRNRLELIAIIAALSTLKRPCEVEVVTSCKFIADHAGQENVELWKRAEWTRARGKHLRNKDLWQQYWEAKEPHKIAFTYSAFNVYGEKLQKMIKEEQKTASDPVRTICESISESRTDATTEEEKDV